MSRSIAVPKSHPSSVWMVCAFLSVLLAWLMIGINPASSDSLGEADRAQIQSMIQAQTDAFQSGNAAAAFSHAAPSIKRMFGDENRFVTMVERQYLPVYRPQSFIFGRLKMTERGPAQEVFITGPNGNDWVAVYTLEKQPDGDWKISGCFLHPVPGAKV